MKEGLENMDHLFRRNLFDYSQSPPEEVWGKIEQSLAGNRKRILIPQYIKIAASIILLAGLGSISWRYLANHNKTGELASIKKVDHKQVPLKSEQTATSNSEQTNTSHFDIQLKSEKPSITKNNSEINTNNQISAMVATENTSAPADNHLLVSEVADSGTNPMMTEVIAESDITQPVIIEPNNLIVDKEKPINPVITNEMIIQQNLLAIQQDEQSIKDDHSLVWSVGGEAGPQYTYRNVHINSPNNQLSDFNETEKGLIAYAGGVHIELETSKRFSVQSGIFYSKFGQSSTVTYNSNPSDIGTSWFDEHSYIDETVPTEVVTSIGNYTMDKGLNQPVGATENLTTADRRISGDQYLEFLEFPFICSYKIIDQKLDVNLSSGLWTNLLIGNKTYAVDNLNNANVTTTNTISKVNYSASVAIGFEYPVARNLTMNLQPIFKYYLTPTVNSEPVTRTAHPYSFSLMTGVQYSF
jgi:hypothetical protein